MNYNAHSCFIRLNRYETDFFFVSFVLFVVKIHPVHCFLFFFTGSCFCSKLLRGDMRPAEPMNRAWMPGCTFPLTKKRM